MNTVISNIFEEMFKAPSTANSNNSPVVKFKPKTNIYKTDDAYVIESNVAGIPKESIQIDIEDNNLKISYTAPTAESTPKYIRKEFQTDSFERNFKLGDMIDMDGIHANVENGILSIKLPIKAVVKPSVKRIEIL